MSTQGKLLIVDDELSVRDSLAKWFREEGYEIGTAENANDALTRLAEQRWDAALVDIKMHGTDGIELQRRMHEVDPELLVIIMTGYASVETAVTALKNGAYDYVTKPLDPDEIAHLVKNALAHKRAAQENVLLRETVAEVARPGELIGQSSAMRKIFDAIETVGPTDATVLVTGESGTGKELVARAIHNAGDRASKPFVAVSCAALAETLLESELFGHEKGSFTGANQQKPGKFEMADTGTIFLDEIGDISPKLQVDLLRVLQNRSFYRVGGSVEVKVDVRVVAATHVNLQQAVADGKFRDDLYYRLNVIEIRIPPLRERREDIPLLAHHFVERLSHELGKDVSEVSEGALRLLMDYNWPGNVRELENAVERAMVTCRGPVLTERDFGFLAQTAAPATGWAVPAGMTIEDMEKVLITATIQRTQGNIKEAASVLGIDRSTLYEKIKKYEIAR